MTGTRTYHTSTASKMSAAKNQLCLHSATPIASSIRAVTRGTLCRYCSELIGGYVGNVILSHHWRSFIFPPSNQSLSCCGYYTAMPRPCRLRSSLRQHASGGPFLRRSANTSCMAPRHQVLLETGSWHHRGSGRTERGLLPPRHGAPSGPSERVPAAWGIPRSGSSATALHHADSRRPPAHRETSGACGVYGAGADFSTLFVEP